MNPAVLERLARRWRWRTLTREILLVLGLVGVAAAGVVPWARTTPWGPLIAVGIGASFTRLRAARPWRIDPRRVAESLNRSFPELEESAGLSLRAPGSLTVPERLQRQRLDAAWTGLLARGVRPERAPAGFWRRPLATFAVGALALAAASVWRTTHPRQPTPVAGHPAAVAPVAPSSPPTPARPRLAGVELTVVPPAYTGRGQRAVPGFDAEVEEGAVVTWQVRLEGAPAREAGLVFDAVGGAKRLPLRELASGMGWQGTREVGASPGLYGIVVRPGDGPEFRLPDVGSLKILPDAPPVVTILQPSGSRTELDPVAGPVTLPVAVRVTDDYGVSGARLVVTVAKGSGEAVKFRERAVEFDPPAGDEASGGRERRFTVTLDPAALGMEPGDELYFHVDAEDNHPPTAHRTRSETRFVVLRGPASAPVQAGRGLAGVNLVPEYFRSERQIILDTERLLAERDRLPEREFRRRSGDLGADQALLRLRYGQFVGEESEAGAGGGGDHAEVNLNPLRAGVPSGVPADLVHRHDGGEAPVANDPRAGLRTAMRLRLEHDDQARGGGGHDGAPAAPDAGLPPTAGQIVAPFVDQHDSQDAATLFDRETKASLRGVLAAMWTAEGLLRTTRPADALEPEHRALDLLKELQQGERLYVQRVGFEPTPLRVAERRGRGDVADVPERTQVAANAPAEDPAEAGLRASLAALPGGNGPARRIAPDLRQALGRAGPALSEAAARQGGGFLEGLRALRRLEETEGNSARPGDVTAVRSALLGLLPAAEEHPRRPWEAAPTLVRRHEETGGGSPKP